MPVSIKRVVLFKSKIHLCFKQDTKEIKPDISIVKWNISNFHKAVISRTMFMEFSSPERIPQVKICRNSV